jgi:hypothetical protein
VTIKELEEQCVCVCVCVGKFAANLVKILQRYFNCLTKHTEGALSSRSALSVLVGGLFKKFGLFLIRGLLPPVSVFRIFFISLCFATTETS